MSQFVEGRPTKDLEDAFRSAKLDPTNDRGMDIESGYNMALSEEIWLLDSHGDTDKEKERPVDFLDHCVVTKVEFFSVDNQCSTSCYSYMEPIQFKLT